MGGFGNMLMSACLPNNDCFVRHVPCGVAYALQLVALVKGTWPLRRGRCMVTYSHINSLRCSVWMTVFMRICHVQSFAGLPPALAA